MFCYDLCFIATQLVVHFVKLIQENGCGKRDTDFNQIFVWMNETISIDDVWELINSYLFYEINTRNVYECILGWINDTIQL